MLPTTVSVMVWLPLLFPCEPETLEIIFRIVSSAASTVRIACCQIYNHNTHNLLLKIQWHVFLTNTSMYLQNCGLTQKDDERGTRLSVLTHVNSGKHSG